MKTVQSFHKIKWLCQHVTFASFKEGLRIAFTDEGGAYFYVFSLCISNIVLIGVVNSGPFLNTIFNFTK